MKIGVDIRTLSFDQRSGVGNYVFHTLQDILDQDKINTYYFFSSGLKKFILPVSLKQDNVVHIHIAWPNKVLNLFFLFNILKDFTRFSPVVLDAFWLPNLNFFRINDKTPLILTVHDLSFLHSRQFYSLKMKWWHSLVNIKKLIKRADQVVAVSLNTQRDIMRFFTVREEKLKIVYPSLHVHAMTRERALDLTKDLSLKKDFFLFLGTIEPRKNIQSIIKAFDAYHLEYPETDLLLVGNKGWLYNPLFRLLKKRDYIKYIGFIAGAKRDALYFLSQALIWPSFYEGFGFPPLEATVQAKPVIVSYKTSLPEIMKEQALYVDPYNPAEIYQLLKQLTNDQNLRQYIIDKAKKFVIPDKFKQTQTILNIFKNAHRFRS